ncbi:Hcp family type VI secretion system effector [Lysobacter capsici]|uniref:Hcp family type VI secretion system effector n=1 Tax=Lysobacter capsici TaxID=435897 RepID=UPI001C004D04|nr:type VI secretion system tube protein Hcp [Lysobacter capsici]QWF19574.1 type VI secretion system tube protein Hcp [Lysobacter capsici]
MSIGNQEPKQKPSVFLKIGPFKGESRDNDHKDWIELLDFNFEVVQPRSATGSSAGGHTAARSEISTINILKEADLSSTAFLQAAANGSTLDKMTVNVRRADGKDGKAINYRVFEAMNIVVSKVRTFIGNNGLLMEEIQLSIATMKDTYTAQGIEGGPKGNSTFQYSWSKNTPQYTTG